MVVKYRRSSFLISGSNIDFGVSVTSLLFLLGLINGELSEFFLDFLKGEGIEVFTFYCFKYLLRFKV